MNISFAFKNFEASDHLKKYARAAYLTKEFQRRFTERFQYLNCRELLSHKDLRPTELARSLAAGDHCGLLIATAAEILCEMMETERKRA